VVAPLFKFKRVHKVLMDGRSGINVLYASTLDDMGIPRSALRPSTAPFHRVVPRDGFGSDTHGYESGCHYLPNFISNSDTNTNIVEYEYKTDISNSDSHSNIYSIYSIES
jgi:hypothetical protein